VLIIVFSGFKDIERLFFQVFDTRRIRKTQHMCGSKDGLTIAMCVCRMDIAFDDIIVQKNVDFWELVSGA